MKVLVVGFDPSMTNWGIAKGNLDLTTGFLNDLHLTLIEPEKLTGKQVRQNSTDLYVAKQLAETALKAVQGAKFVFVEIPVGSQSARAMASYGMCVGILGVFQAQGIPLIEVTATEVKQAISGKRIATKREMIDAAAALYPDADFPRHKGKIIDKAEHLADAIGAIHAGVQTQMFMNAIRLLNSI